MAGKSVSGLSAIFVRIGFPLSGKLQLGYSPAVEI